jgi:lysine-specific demethylase 8
MGGVLLKKDLESAIEIVTAKSREKESEGFEKGPKCKFVEEGDEFDKEEVRFVSNSFYL